MRSIAGNGQVSGKVKNCLTNTCKGLVSLWPGSTFTPRSFLLLEHSLQPTPSPICGLASCPPAWRLLHVSRRVTLDLSIFKCNCNIIDIVILIIDFEIMLNLALSWVDDYPRANHECTLSIREERGKTWAHLDTACPKYNAEGFDRKSRDRVSHLFYLWVCSQ